MGNANAHAIIKIQSSAAVKKNSCYIKSSKLNIGILASQTASCQEI